VSEHCSLFYQGEKQSDTVASRNVHETALNNGSRHRGNPKTSQPFTVWCIITGII